jgi:anti-anti-sigma factor
MPDDGHVLYARQGDTWVLRFEGNIRYTMAHAVDVFLDQLFAHENPGRVCADLNATTAIDSTGIGLLAKIANGLRGAGREMPIIFSANPEIVETLRNVCLDEVCTIIAGAPEAIAESEIPATTPNERELARTIVAAHCLLCDMCEKNRAQFQSVVDAFAQELKAP